MNLTFHELVTHDLGGSVADKTGGALIPDIDPPLPIDAEDGSVGGIDQVGVVRLQIGIDEVGRLVRMIIPIAADGCIVLRTDGHLLELLEAAGQRAEILLAEVAVGKEILGGLAGGADVGGDAPLGMAGSEQAAEDDAPLLDGLLVRHLRGILGLAGAGGLGVDGHGGDERLPGLAEVLAGALLEDLGGLAADGAALPLFVVGAGGGVRARPAVGEARPGRMGLIPAVGGGLAVLGLLGQQRVRADLEHDRSPAEGVGRSPHVVVGLLVEATLDQVEGIGLVDGRVDREGGRQGGRAVGGGGDRAAGLGAARGPVVFRDNIVIGNAPGAPTRNACRHGKEVFRHGDGPERFALKGNID